MLISAYSDSESDTTSSTSLIEQHRALLRQDAAQSSPASDVPFRAKKVDNLERMLANLAIGTVDRAWRKHEEEDQDQARKWAEEFLTESKKTSEEVDRTLQSLRSRWQTRAMQLAEEEETAKAAKAAEKAAREKREQEERERSREAEARRQAKIELLAAQERKREAEKKKLEEEIRLKEASAKASAAAEREKQQKEQEERQEQEKRKQVEEKAKRDVEQEAARRADEEKKIREAHDALEAKNRAEERAQQTAATSDFTSWAAVDAEFNHYQGIIKRIKTDVNAPVSNDKELRKSCFDLKTKLKPRVGQLTNSKSQLIVVKKGLDEVLQIAKSRGDLVYRWTLNMLAKFIVQQGESESNVAVEAAIPLGLLSTLIWTEFPEFGEFLIARYVKKCPQIIGYTTNTDTEEGRKRMGMKKIDGRWETEERYSERIAGIIAVWSAMTQSRLASTSTKQHPYPFSHAWVFLARQLNTPTEKLRNDNFSAVAAWWDISAKRCLEVFGKQGEKALLAACQDWVQTVEANKWPAAMRLRLLGNDWERAGAPVEAYKPMGR